MNKDSDDIDQPQNLKEWITLFKQLRKKSLLKLESGKIQRGRRGHDVTLVLDCSGRMQGKSFTTMIEAATKYVNGIKQVKMITSLEDNIGLAVFGGTSGLIVESTSNYDLVLKEISQLRPGGEAPLFGGLLMGLSGVLGSTVSKILENEVPGFIIVFTDKMAGNTSIDKKKEIGIDPLYFIGNAHEQDDIGSVISMIESHSIKIFYVPIGENIRNEVMERAVSKTKGKVIPLNELHRLVKMTQELILAARVASDFRHTNPHPTADDVRLSISERSSNPNDAHDDCVDLVLEFVDTLSADKNKGLYNELECRSLQLGDRVRRGPQWRHDKQDSGLAGTVVGQIQNEEVWVEWDSGHLNKYIYDEKVNFYSVKKVDEARVLVDELVAVGCKVTRGNDWKYNNDDGGPGSIGTVLCVKDNGSVVVRWDCKKIGVYKMKTNDSFEIQICADSPTYKQTAEASLSTNKQKSAEFVIGNFDASTQKNTVTSITKNSDKQEEEHNVKSVPHANTDSDPVNFSQPQNIREWLELSERLRKQSLLKRISGKIQRGRHGHDVTLVLDCSERMRGQTFTTMIEAAKKYVNGIKQVKMATSLEDNIGLAVFGGKSGLIIESTSNYDLVLEEICKLQPEGEAPLFGGFLMGLSGVLGIGATSQIMYNEVQGYMIVFTDGMAGKTSTDKKNTFGIDPSYLIGNVHRHDEIGRVISLIASHLIKIFYVPIGDNIRNEVMEMAVSKTKGKVIPLNELHRLVKMTQELILAAQVASDLRRTNPNPTAEDVRSSILQRTSNPDDAHDDCVDLVLEFVYPLSADKNKGLYNELECRSLQLGDRVRRGPNWMHEEQDSGRVGTVVGQDQDKEVWVEWDSGHLNIYIYNEDIMIYSIKKVQEPRVLVDELVAVGCKVKRGNDWKYDNDDGGPGSIGTVLGVKDNGSVVVRWDCKTIGIYKMGKNGLFEIQICNDSSTHIPTDKADVTTNKQPGAEFAIVNVDASQQKNTSTANSDKQEQKHYDESVPHANTENDANLTDEKGGNDISNIVKISNVPPQMTVQTLRLYVEGLSEDMKSSVGHIRFDDNTSTAFIDFITNEAAETFILMDPTEIEGCQVKCEKDFPASQDDMDDVMSEIKNLGFETVQGFEEIMKKGSFKCYWNRVYLVGNYNIGKTTLAKVLVGDPVPEVKQSTDGIWLYIGLAGMDIDQQKWIFLPKGSGTKTVISSMLMSLSSQEDRNPPIEEPFELPVQTGSIESNTEEAVNANTIYCTTGPKDKSHGFFDREISQIEKDSEMSTFFENLSPIKQPEMGNIIEAMSNEKIRELVIKVARDGRYKMKIVPIDIWDFGGQKDYYMTHQLFITSRGIFVLMFNGSQNMHQHMSDLSFLPGHYGKPTIAVYLKHWVNSILTFCRRVKECFPKILFVATHKDLVPKNDVEQQRQYLIQSIHELFEYHSGNGHLEYQNLLFIDARDSSDKEIAILKQLLIQRAIDHPRWGEDMPTAWVPLELELLQEVENGNNIISRSQLEALNNENKAFTLTPKQLEGFLKIQHSFGKLIYFDEMNLRNFIIINPVYLIEILRSIVTDEQFLQRGESFRESFQRLRNEGIIEKKTIYSIWAQDEFSHILPFKEFMLDILIHLDIIVSPRTDLENLPIPLHTVSFYLVPCMITYPSKTNYVATYCNDNTSIVLAYTFVDDVIPPALSYRFLGSILTMWDLKIYNGTRMMFCDLTVVEIDDDHDVAVQVIDKRVVVSLVHHDNKKRIVPTLAASIQECLTAAIYRISKFYSSLSSDSITNKGLNTTMPFEIEFGVFCQSLMCYHHHRKMPSAMKVAWECPQHKTEHDVRYLHYWYVADKKHAESCSDTCSGPGKLEIEQFPSDQHLRRLVTKLNINTCRELAISLGMKVHVWEDLEYQFQHDNTDNIKFMALWKWKQKHKTACIGDLIRGLKKCNTSIHNICQVFRDECTNYDLSENILDGEPTKQLLKAVSDYIGNSSLQLGIELGLDVPQLENIQNQLKNKPLEQTREILTRWRESDQFTPSVRSLIKALNRIDKAACVFYINF